MTIDEEVVLDFEMTPWLKELVDDMERAFETGDEVLWDTNFDTIGHCAKTDHMCGYITSEQANKIYERYGTGP